MAVVIPFPVSAQSKKQKVSCAKSYKHAVPENETHRKAMLGKIHMWLPKLYASLDHFDEDKYRYYLQENFGTNTAATLSCQQLHSVLLYLAELYFKHTKKHLRKGKANKKDAPAALKQDGSGLNREALLSKIEQMLTVKSIAEKTDVPWSYAVGILKKQSGGITKHLDMATREQLQAVIAALRYDAQRKGY